MKIVHLMSATALAGSLLVIAPAYGQVDTRPDVTRTPPAPTTVDEQDNTDPGETGSIIVTGSRIRLPNVENLEPTVTIGSAFIENRNLTNVADALNEIPGYRGSVTPNGAQGSFGQGVNFINTFGLGSNRNLTLLNGRRVVSSNVATVFGNAGAGTQVDLNVIPTILVDRIERVSVGGAPTYGSDAIAGTTNIILKDRFTGVEARATSGITEQGDNFRVNLSAAAGFNFAGGRGNLTAAVSYDKTDGVLSNDRAFLRENIGNQLNLSPAEAALFGPAGRTPANDGRVNPNIGFNTGPADGIPGSVLVRGAGIPSLSRGGVIANIGALRPLDYNFQFDGNSNLVNYNTGTLFGAALPGAAARSAGGNAFLFNDFTQITSNLQRISGNLFANFELTDRITAFAEGMYFQGKGDELVQQNSFNSTLFGGVSGALTFDVNNPFLSAQARNLLASNGYQTFRLSRINLDLADATGSSKSELYRGVVGLRGDFDVSGRTFNFEVSGNYGRNDFTDFSQAIDQQRFVNAVNVANVGGQIVCTATPTVNATPGFTPVADANCRPLNLFGENVASQEARNYVIRDVVANSRLEQWVINANVGGSPFDIFGNPVGFNIGYEHRDESASFVPDAFQQGGLGRAVAIAPNAGSYNLDEVFGEVLVPLFSPNNDFFLHSAEIFGKARYVDNTVNGGFLAWSAGGRFSPIRDVQFRGNFTKSFRAPAITELFSPQTNTFTTVPDLCSVANINAGPVPVTRARNCAAFLTAFPTATPLSAATATVPGRTGGNPALENEVADSFTFGVVLQPRFVPGLSLTVDYIDIKIRQPIASLTVAQIASGCFDNEAFNAADPANGNAFCSQIRRDATGQVPADPLNPAVTSGFVNGQQISMEAIQATLDYSTALTGIGLPGRVNIGGDLFYLRRRIVDTTGIAPARSDGIIGDPEFSGLATIGYTDKTWGFTTNVNYTGEQLFSRFNRGPSPSDIRELDQLKDFVTINGSVFVDVQERMRLTLAVTNLTNRLGQDYFGILHPSSINDSFGRRFSASVRIRY